MNNYQNQSNQPEEVIVHPLEGMDGSESQNGREEKEMSFLDQLHEEITQVIANHADEIDSDGAALTENIYLVAQQFVKQSWKNGIEAGVKRASRQKGSGGNPKFSKGKQAINRAVNRAGGQKQRPWQKNKYQN